MYSCVPPFQQANGPFFREEQYIPNIPTENRSEVDSLSALSIDPFRSFTEELLIQDFSTNCNRSFTVFNNQRFLFNGPESYAFDRS